jgi:hypothetical protein
MTPGTNRARFSNDQDIRTATPDFQAATESLNAACGIATRYIPPFTPLQSAARDAVLDCLPRGFERTAIALFNELGDVIRDLRRENENHEKHSEFREHNLGMRAKFAALLQTVAPLVGEKYSPTTTDKAAELFIADRITSKLNRLLAPGNIKSWDVSGETATGDASSPEKHSANWFRAQRQATPEESERLLAGKLYTAEDHNRAVAVIHGVPINIFGNRVSNDSEITPVHLPNSLTTEEELKELRFQNGELSRQLEVAQASEKLFREEIAQINNVLQPFREELFAAELTHVSIDYIVSRLVFAWNKYKAEMTCTSTLSDEVKGWHTAAEKYAEVVEAWRNNLDIIAGCALGVFGIEEVADQLRRKDTQIANLKSNLAHAPKTEEIEAVQKERDELSTQLSDIKLAMAKHLSGDPLFHIVPLSEAIDQKLCRLGEFDSAFIDMVAVVTRLSEARIDYSYRGTPDCMARYLNSLAAFRLGAEAAQKQNESKAAPAKTNEKDDDSDITLPKTPNVIPPSHEEFLRGCGILALTKGKRHCVPKFLALRYAENPANAHECMRELSLSGTEWANFRDTGERIVTYCADKNLVKGTEERKEFDRVLAEFCDKADSMDGVKPAKREPKDF